MMQIVMDEKEQIKVLAKVYQLILSWPDPSETETADSKTCREERESAVRGAHTKKRAAK